MSKETTIKEIAKEYWDYKSRAVAVMEDGTTVVLFGWFADELSISEWDLRGLVGKTADEAREWYHAEDVRYLQS
jgi:hypothetical protein